MQLTINLPDREETLAFHLKRWDEILHDRDLARLCQRIETNAWGQIIMTPPAKFIHSRRQAKIAHLVESLIGGYTATECGIVTSDGVKIADVVWLSPSSFHLRANQSVQEQAPEICVEILSPSNSPNEIRNKIRLYFDAGAIECWICDLEGRMTYYLNDEPDEIRTESKLCPEFPEAVVE